MRRLLLSMTLIFTACGDGQDLAQDEDEIDEEEEGEEEEGAPSGALCPDDSTLTYENFGMAFMQTYCTNCHSSVLSGADRLGAPAGYDFDSLEGILDEAYDVDENAAAGPDATNDEMPISSLLPSLEERQMLGEWLACETAP